MDEQIDRYSDTICHGCFHGGHHWVVICNFYDHERISKSFVFFVITLHYDDCVVVGDYGHGHVGYRRPYIEVNRYSAVPW